MVNVYPLSQEGGPDERARFNVLLTQDRPRGQTHWTTQFPRLLRPHGVVSYVAHSGREAIDLAQTLEIHAAVIDLGTPFERDHPTRSPLSSTITGEALASGAGGQLWLVELFRRLPNQPPVVVVHHPTYSQRQIERLLREALRLGAFSVLNKPVDLEEILRVFRRLVDRQYRGSWPSHGGEAMQ